MASNEMTLDDFRAHTSGMDGTAKMFIVTNQGRVYLDEAAISYDPHKGEIEISVEGIWEKGE